MRRLYEHKQNVIKGFTAKYKIHLLVYYEQTYDVHTAITREKQIKGWSRTKRILLIEENNPTWKDISEDWFK